MKRKKNARDGKMEGKESLGLVNATCPGRQRRLEVLSVKRNVKG